MSPGGEAGGGGGRVLRSAIPKTTADYLSSFAGLDDACQSDYCKRTASLTTEFSTMSPLEHPRKSHDQKLRKEQQDWAARPCGLESRA